MQPEERLKENLLAGKDGDFVLTEKEMSRDWARMTTLVVSRRVLRSPVVPGFCSFPASCCKKPLLVVDGELWSMLILPLTLNKVCHFLSEIRAVPVSSATFQPSSHLNP